MKMADEHDGDGGDEDEDQDEGEDQPPFVEAARRDYRCIDYPETAKFQTDNRSTPPHDESSKK
jgi:hypothetical protein